MSKNRRNPDASIREAETQLADQVTGRLRSALLVLSPLERAIVSLHNGFAFSPAEVADILGIEESQVTDVLKELRPRLREMGPLIGRKDTGGEGEDDSAPPPE
ncbi:MAG TPA: sigma factor-like helix-turn-helix DNA-binding protein [Streptosporangiaceae bacterium]|jgi:DNA-directed RNA polymerase specialized sigma24 family protein|nr:sigma factor-like helix-turn-helix DNA-binding protein [Streptosporangiaceae bacterium]